jgi:hypothetical protein
VANNGSGDGALPYRNWGNSFRLAGGNAAVIATASAGWHPIRNEKTGAVSSPGAASPLKNAADGSAASIDQFVCQLLTSSS